MTAADFPKQFNVSVLITTGGDDGHVVEKFLIVNIKDKSDFNLTLSKDTVSIHIFFGDHQLCESVHG